MNVSAPTAKKLLLRDTVDTSFYRFDPDLGFWGIAGMERDVSFEQRRGEFIRVKHNEQGNRDDSFVVGKDNADIICIGGSHTWGGAVEQELRYSDVLQKTLGRRVANLGHCSLGLDQVCLAVLKYAERYSARTVIVEQYPWALHRVLATSVNGYVKPQFSLDAGGQLQLTKIPRLAHYPAARNLIGSFHAYQKELREFQAGIDLKSSYDPKTDPIFLLWKTTYYQHMYLLVDKIVGAMKDFCSQKNIRLVFGVGAVAQQFGAQSPSALIDYDLPMKTFARILDRRGIHYVTMVDRMLAAHTAEDPCIFTDGHINAKGHRIFAEALIDEFGGRELAA